MKKILFILLLASPLITTVFSEENTEGKLLSRVKHVFPLRLPGEIIELKKMLLPSGETKLISSSSEYNTMDEIRTLVREEEQLARQRYGKIRGELRGIYEYMSSSDTVAVEVMLDVPLTEDMLQRYNVDTSSVRGNDYIGGLHFICTALKSNLSIIAFDGDVVSVSKFIPYTPIFGGDEYHYDTLPMTTAEGYAMSAFMLPDSLDTVPSYAKGKGVVCATNEYGLHPDYLDSLRIQYGNNTQGHNATVNAVYTHTLMTYGCMARAAPEGTWTHVTGTVYGSVRKYNIQTISRSTSGSSDPESSTMMEIDAFIYDNTINPLFCNGAANDGLHLIANWGAYNGISVGGSDYFNNEYYGIAGITRTGYKFRYYDRILGREYEKYLGTENTLTQTRNPLRRSALYAGIYGDSTVSDREMPNIVAPSTVSYGGLLDGIIYKKLGEKQGIGGCSGAAPTVNGVAACIISSNRSEMENHPENIKTALMVTAVNIDGGMWNPLEDGRDGCGEVAGYDACIYVHDQCEFVQCGDTAEYGMGYGVLYQSAPPDTVLEYYVRIPDPVPDSRHLRVMVNWSGSPGLDASGNLDENIISNLDIFLIDCATGKVAGACGSFDDNIEVIDIYPSYKTSPGEIYRIEVRVENLAFPAVPVADYIRYSVGWAWPLDYAGKKIAVRGSEENLDYRLLNRNLQIGPAAINAGCNMQVTAANRITLIPGTTIKEGSNFFAKIARKEVHYSLENFSNREDYSGNLRDAVMRGPNNRDIDMYSQGRIKNRWCSWFNGTDNYMIINSTGIKENPEPHTGLTAVFWMRWLPGMDMGGPILCATEAGTVSKGYSISINKFGVLQFCIGNSSAYSLVFYDLDSHDYYDGRYPSNRGWTHIAAVWSAGEYMKLYVNGEEKACNTSSIVETHSFPGDSMFLGKDWSNNYFKGSLGEFALFSGTLADTTIKGLVHVHNWPKYQGEEDHRSEVAVDIEGNGHIDLAVDFNPGYRYTGSITQDTVISFPEYSELYRTVDFTFVPETGWRICEVIIDVQPIIPTPPNYNYDVKDHENGSIRVIFQQ